MRAQYVLVLALFACLPGASLLRAGDTIETQDDNVAQLEERLTQAQRKRVLVAQRAFEAANAAYASGHITLDVLLDAVEKRAEAHLAAATTPDQRVSACEERLKAAGQIESKIEALFRTGSRGGEAVTYTMAQRARLSAEIELLEEKLRAAKAD